MVTCNFQFAFKLVFLLLLFPTLVRILHRRFRITHVGKVPFASNISQNILTFFLKSSGVGFGISIGSFLKFSFSSYPDRKNNATQKNAKTLIQVSMKVIMTQIETKETSVESSVWGIPPPKFIPSVYFSFYFS